MMRLARALLPLVLLASCATASDPIVEQASYATAPKPAYPLLAKRQGIEGSVKLKVQILADGFAGKVEVAKSSGSALLDASAIESVKRTKFHPARTASGRSVDSWMEMPIRFVIDGSRPNEAGNPPGSLSAPSAAYSKMLSDAVRRHIVLAAPVAPNSVAEIEILTEPDGRIRAFKLMRAEGSAEWSAAVLKALAKVDRLPLEADGRIRPRIVLMTHP